MESFDSRAKDYDTDKRVERARAISGEIRAHVAGAGGSALEYGCGTGLVGLQLADAFASLMLVDSSPGMIEQVEQKLREINDPRISAMCCDFTEGVPQGLRADYIFLSLVLHHIKDTTGILRRFYGLLNDGGRLLIVDLDPDDGSFHAKYPDFDGHNGFEQSALVQMAVEAGFARADAKTFYRDIKTVDGREAPYSLFILDAVKHS